MIKRISIALILVLYCGQRAFTQQKEAKRNLVSVGVLNVIDRGAILLLSYERTLGHHLSASFSIGANPPRKSTFAIKYFQYHLDFEGRFYFAFRRDLPLSGFFVGPYFSFTESYSWHIVEKRKAIRSFWKSYGVSLGYRHVFRNGISVSAQVLPGLQGRYVLEQWNQAGFRTARFVWRGGVTYFPSISLGFSF